MTYLELISEVAKKTEYPVRICEDICVAMRDSIIKGMRRDNCVRFKNFATFNLVLKPGRRYLNFKEHKLVVAEPKWHIELKLSDNFKNNVLDNYTGKEELNDEDE